MIETADRNGIAILTLNNGPVNALDFISRVRRWQRRDSTSVVRSPASD